jgi:hypothetical protein
MDRRGGCRIVIALRAIGFHAAAAVLDDSHHRRVVIMTALAIADVYSRSCGM